MTAPHRHVFDNGYDPAIDAWRCRCGAFALRTGIIYQPNGTVETAPATQPKQSQTTGSGDRVRSGRELPDDMSAREPMTVTIAKAQRRRAARAAAGVPSRAPSTLCGCLEPLGRHIRQARLIVCDRCHLVLPDQRTTE